LDILIRVDKKLPQYEISLSLRIAKLGFFIYLSSLPMKYPILQVAVFISVASLFTSCGSQLETLAKNDIKFLDNSRSTKTAIAVGEPSSRVILSAVGKPKDKHSMPVYNFRERNRLVRTTAYTCSEDDHLQYGNMNATGTKLQFSDKVRSTAADWSFYPVGTLFRIKGMRQLFVVDDYGSALTGTGTIDMYKPSRAMMNRWGRRNVEISVVRWGSFKRSAEILSGRTKFSHCRQMLANITRQRPELKYLVSR